MVVVDIVDAVNVAGVVTGCAVKSCKKLPFTSSIDPVALV